MAALASQRDIEAILARSLASDEFIYAGRLLDMASRVVRTFTGQQIDRSTDTVTLRIPAPQGPHLRRAPHVVLPQRPVVTVNTVTAGGVTLASSAWYINDGTLYLGAGDTWPSINGSPFGQAGEITVNYTHGYVPVPDDVVLVVASMVAQRLRAAAANPDGASSEQIGTYAVRFESGSATAGLVLGDADRQLLRPYTRDAGVIYTGSAW